MTNNQTSNSEKQPVSQWIGIDDLRLHYLTCGEGDPILLLHGWPTSSHLWRNVMPQMAATHRVIALDLPGFGQSTKPLDRTYSFKFYTRVIDTFLIELGIEKTGLVVHDLGGPVGLMWAVKNPQKVTSLGLLNTLVYPEMSWAVKAFMLLTFLPGIKRWLVSASGLEKAMKFGVRNKHNITAEVLEPYQAPFKAIAAQNALLKAAQGLHPRGFEEIAEKLPQFKIPVRLIYGENDRILPDIARTMARIKKDLPQAELTALPNCGHFLQEDNPEELGKLLNSFFANKA